jgi:hypothetical protein
MCPRHLKKGGKEVNISRCSIAMFLMLLTIFIPGACGFSLSVSGGENGVVVSSTTGISAPDNTEVKSSGSLSGTGLTQTTSGAGDLSDSKSVGNTAGSYAKVGWVIRNAQSYSVSYNILPGEGGGWPASAYPQVSAGESLDVLNANYIKAYAQSHNA